MKNSARRVRSTRANPDGVPSARGRPAHTVAEDEPLTRAQMRELDRRMKDLDDRTRYLLVSVFGPRFVLYYNVSEDTYGMSEPAHATVFKRRAAAVAVRKMLGGGVQIVQCDVDGHGQLVLNSLPARWRRPPRKATSRRSPSG